ncbi:hypothetical protein CRG98_018357, partial [Punica granatum]
MASVVLLLLYSFISLIFCNEIDFSLPLRTNSGRTRSGGDRRCVLVTWTPTGSE